jgi:hypothetical protein
MSWPQVVTYIYSGIAGPGWKGSTRRELQSTLQCRNTAEFFRTCALERGSEVNVQAASMAYAGCYVQPGWSQQPVLPSVQTPGYGG